MKRPAFQFYPSDWRKDLALRKCSLAARGMWIELMCIAHECEPYGTLRHNGEALQADDIAGLVGMCSPREAKKLIDELTRKGVAKVDDAGVIYSKRMVDDERLREQRAQVGRDNGLKGAAFGVMGAEHGKKGGRPKGKNPGSKPGHKPPQNPHPSSSSSSSPSGSEPNGSVPTPSVPEGVPAVKSRAVAKVTEPPPTAAVWASYSAAFRKRYGVDPVRNKTVNGILANFVARLPADESPPVAAHFVRSNQGLYVSSMHAVNLLLRDAEKLRTEWATGRNAAESQPSAYSREKTEAADAWMGKFAQRHEGANTGGPVFDMDDPQHG